MVEWFDLLCKIAALLMLIVAFLDQRKERFDRAAYHISLATFLLLTTVGRS